MNQCCKWKASISQGKRGSMGKERGWWQFWPSHSCVSLVETRCHHLVSSLPCRDHRRLPRRLPPAPGPGRAGTLPTDRKGSCHYTTHWEYTANRQKGFLPRWDSANRQEGFRSLHNTLGIHCQLTERVPATLGLCQQTERVLITTQHIGNTLPTDRKSSHHYTTHWEYTANRQKGFPSLHNTLGIHCWWTERVPVTLGLCQLTEWVPVTTQHWQYTSLKAKPHDALQPATQLCNYIVTSPLTFQLRSKSTLQKLEHIAYMPAPSLQTTDNEAHRWKGWLKGQTK